MRAVLRHAQDWAGPISMMAVMSIALSLSVPLFALLMERLGVSATVIGLNHTVAAVAMVVSAPLLPAIMARVGLVPLMFASIVVLAFCMAAIPLFESVWWWALLRIGFGTAATALFFGSEFWVVSNAPDHMRGRIVGGYVLILSVSYMIGPLLLNLLGIDTWLTFAVPTAIILASAIPLAIGRAAAPDPATDAPTGVRETLRYFRTDPMVVFGVVLFGVIEFGAMGLIAVWGVRSGLEMESAVHLVFWLAFGSMLFQLPVGWAADRYDRRLLLTVCAAVSIVAPLTMLADGGASALTPLAVILWGGMAVAFYSIALTELGARYQGQAMAQANAAVVLAYGLGALLAPAAFGAAMDAIPPDGLLWLATAASCGYLALAVVRIRTQRRLALDSGGKSGR